MKKPPLVAFILVILTSTSGIAAVYQWDDSSGMTHFSDISPAKAKTVELPKSTTSTANTTTPNTTASFSTIDTKNSDTERTKTYQKIFIMQPQNQATIQYDAGKVSITVSLEPELKDGDKVAVYLDGNKIMENQSSSFELKNIERGEHTLQAKVIGEGSSALITSPTITFYIHQTSSIAANP